MSYIVILMSFQTIYSINYGHNNKLSRLGACPSAMREGKKINTHFWAA
jgi:hypothetical protein